MSLKEALSKEREVSATCTLCKVLPSMPKDEREYLEESLLDPECSSVAIYRSLRKEGYKVGQHTVYSHRSSVISGRQCL